MHKSADDAPERLKLILNKMPNALNLQEWDGITPLQLAFQLRRLPAAKYLIERGANQALRDKQGYNILHDILLGEEGERCIRSAKLLDSMCQMIDPALLETLAVQRMMDEAKLPGDVYPTPTFQPPALFTPLAAWLDGSSNDTQSPDVLRKILQWTNAAGLRTMDGKGDYPIHLAIKKGLPQLATVLLEHDPEVLYWENATGNTGLELLDRAYVRDIVDHWRQFSSDVCDDYASDGFAYRKPYVLTHFQQWQELREYCRSHPTKRKLVGIFEANELVRRLESYKPDRKKNKALNNWSGETEEEKDSELQRLFRSAVADNAAVYDRDDDGQK
jgi:hypothetical protein